MSAASAASQSLPVFDGKRQSFADWNFKLKAVCFDLNLDDILLRPQEWNEAHIALQRRVESRACGVSTRAASTSADSAATIADQTQLSAELGKFKLLARILISKLSPQVSDLHMAPEVPSDVTTQSGCPTRGV